MTNGAPDWNGATALANWENLIAATTTAFPNTNVIVENTWLDQPLRTQQLEDFMLEHRVALLRVLRAALAEPGVYVRIGHENEIPAMHSLALVATGYGVARRRLGAVSVIGPVRMDYASAIVTVREAAQELSRFVEDAYAES